MYSTLRGRVFRMYIHSFTVFQNNSQKSHHFITLRAFVLEVTIYLNFHAKNLFETASANSAILA